MDFNLIKCFCNTEDVRRIVADQRLIFEYYAKNCSISMWKEVQQVNERLAAWMLPYLIDSDDYWKCRGCGDNVIKHRHIARITESSLIVNPFYIDKIYWRYSFVLNKCSVNCHNCDIKLDNGNFNEFVI